MKAFFVAGTDTEIGKTTITAGLTYACAQRGYRSLAIKPISAGQDWIEGRWVNEDVTRLHQASNVELTEVQIGPMQLRTPCAPHIAAALEGVEIHRDFILNSVRETLSFGEVGWVEGVGGFRVPLTPSWDTADLAQDLNLPVVLVVGLRLGCINHALLTEEVMRARGIRLHAWVANQIDAQMPHLDLNLKYLAQALDAPCWGIVPRLLHPSPAAVCTHLHVDAIHHSLRQP
nr:dethiobiotin synthase [uncultured Rhodoferax sp.]